MSAVKAWFPESEVQVRRHSVPVSSSDSKRKIVACNGRRVRTNAVPSVSREMKTTRT